MKRKWLTIIAAGLSGVSIAGCLSDIPHENPVAAPQSETSQPTPRIVAALQLTEQGRNYIHTGQPDHAIRILEKAVNLHPDHGPNYYYLAEAWLMKGVASQAIEFNRLAEMHLDNNRQWADKVAHQAERIAAQEK